ncbi:molybdopterin synthase sulfur carrier subunit [Tenacibaculum sp. MAR_2009_124]|uniref:MoaD/ThiS family protein n=1 Tax=Tenacibaculum sp. MAR_2009_124 TaxID=1250059 RepID=UPI000898EBAE|nr:MoaD/ThiS family protein [Tenacibaculum sp. MAR_2009_124]SEC52859.1 molybdopterin synthase sulfur carrier subunit [Tenacibaculum sp. MAR_2009_124]
MKIQLLAFGVASEILSSSSELLFDNTISVAQLKQHLVTEFPKMSKISSFAIAINEEYANDEQQIQNNDVVAIIPPVSGG